MIVYKQDIEQREQRSRTAFINSLAGFFLDVLVDTKPVEGNTNLAIFNLLIYLGASPALFNLTNIPAIVQQQKTGWLPYSKP